MVNLAPRAMVGSPYSSSSDAKVTPGEASDVGALDSPAAPPLLWFLLILKTTGVAGDGVRVCPDPYSGIVSGRMSTDVRDPWTDSSHPMPAPNVARAITLRALLPRFPVSRLPTRPVRPCSVACPEWRPGGSTLWPA